MTHKPNQRVLKTLNFEMRTVIVSQLEVYYKEDRLLTGLAAQQIVTSAHLICSFFAKCLGHLLVLPIGMVQPRLSKVAVNCPIDTNGSHLTVFLSASISRMSTRFT